jgi:hypothetical protein
MPMEIDPAQAHSIAVVIEDADAFPDMKRGLQPRFRARLANNESAIKDAVEDASLQAMLFDLDSIGEGASDGVEVLQEIRAIRSDFGPGGHDAFTRTHHPFAGEPGRSGRVRACSG